jgi:nucleoside-diphosphate-sugar epimerase
MMIDTFDINAAGFDGPVIVTGAGGCIGSWALKILLAHRIPVTALDLKKDVRRPKLLMSEDQVESIPWIEGDISVPDTILKAVESSRATAIIHLAALQVPFCKNDPILGAQVNVVGTVNVFEAARKFGIKRLCYASSIAAHGVFDENTVPTLYGAYKFCNEETAKVYARDWGVASTGMRPGVVYGVGRDQGMTSKTTIAILAAALREKYTIPFRGDVSWLHAGEVASAFIRSVSAPRSEAKVFDINGSTLSVEDSISIIKKISGHEGISPSGTPLPFPMALSDTPLIDYLGSYGSVEIEKGIKHTYDSFLSLIKQGQIDASALG